MIETLCFVLGDQLSIDTPSIQSLKPDKSVVLMAEVKMESTKVPSHKVRTTFFLSAMRHFAEELRAKGYQVDYIALDDPDNTHTLAGELAREIKRYKPQRVVLTQPGEYSVQHQLITKLTALGSEFEIKEDTHFLSTKADFQQYAQGRKQLRMEFFYREMRKRYDILMESGQPTGGQWNFDAKNRGAFGKKGPQQIPAYYRSSPDATTQNVMALVQTHLPDNPGYLERFDWPVTRSEALKTLEHFIDYLLPKFGQYQDAMWTDEPYLYHSRLSAALNVKLLNSMEVIHAAEQAYRQGNVPIEAAEGFIRQVLGWREYTRGLYWYRMPQYLDDNFFEAAEHLPAFFWTGNTTLNCLKETINQTLEYGYAHHIQRLMVTGLFCLLLGAKPVEVHAWYLGVYLDAIEWVELPNTLGMSQFVDGGVLASKPYVATGKYIQRMSNYCTGCQFDPAESTGQNACPFTTFYWDFLDRHEDKLKTNQRMSLQLRNLKRLDEAKRTLVKSQAAEYRKMLREGRL